MSRANFILLVEDDQPLRGILARHLEGCGYMVLQASTFREATAQLAIKPRLMILDIGLPDASGWEVAAWLESMTDPVPIVLISGRQPDPRQVRRFAPVAFLAKPFTVNTLMHCVQEHMPLPSKEQGNVH